MAPRFVIIIACIICLVCLFVVRYQLPTTGDDIASLPPTLSTDRETFALSRLDASQAWSPHDDEGKEVSSEEVHWPFRYLARNPVLSLLVGKRPKAPDQVCELFVLGHPLCDHYLTDPVVRSSQKSAAPQQQRDRDDDAKHIDDLDDGMPMIECIQRYGVDLWDRLLQPQCTSSSFWVNLVARLRNRSSSRNNKPSRGQQQPRPSSSPDDDDASLLMDPFMKQHMGPMVYPYVPIAQRTYASFGDPLQCKPLPLRHNDGMEISKTMQKTVKQGREGEGDATTYDEAKQALIDAIQGSYAMPTLDGNAGTITHPTRRGPLVLHGIGFGFPSDVHVRKPYRVKAWDWFSVIPGYYPFFRPQLFRRFPRRARYSANALDEYLMTLLQRLSYFAWTHGRGGVECMRTYEIFAAGTVPYFPDVPLYPSWVNAHLPRDLLMAAMKLPGVSHIGTAEALVSPQVDGPFYDQSVAPRWFQNHVQDVRERLFRRLDSLWNESSRPDAAVGATSSLSSSIVPPPPPPCELETLWDVTLFPLRVRGVSHDVIRLLYQPTKTSLEDVASILAVHHHLEQEKQRQPQHLQALQQMVAFGGFTAALYEWCEWLLAMDMEESYEEGRRPVVDPNWPVSSFPHRSNAYMVRVPETPVFNFLRPGDIHHQRFNRTAYYKVADEIHAFAAKHMTSRAIAANTLRVLGNEEPRNILFFGSTQNDYTMVTLWRGLLELGLNVTYVSLRPKASKDIRRGPSLLPWPLAVESKLVRAFPAAGADRATWNGREYDAWRRREELDDIYGKNFMVGRRIAKHPVISEKEACDALASQVLLHEHHHQKKLFDMVFLAHNHRLGMFGLHPCAREIRALMSLQQQQQHQRSSNSSTRTAASTCSTQSSNHKGGSSNHDSSHDPTSDPHAAPVVVVQVAYVDGSDNLNMDTAVSYFQEGITVFARERICW